MKTLLILGGIALLLVSAAGKAYDYYKRLNYRFVGYKINHIDLNQATILLNWQIYNPTPVTLTVNSIQGKVFVNGYYVGDINNTIQQLVYSDSVSNVTLNVIADVKQAGILAISELLSGQFSQFTVKFDGNVTVENITIPLNIESKI